MATVPTSTGTYLSDLVNPQVMGDMINEKLYDNIVFSGLATIDTTLQGQAGDTVTLPYFEKSGDADTVAEGTDIPIQKLTAKTKQVTIVKIGKGFQLTDESILSGYGDPIQECVKQISGGIGSKVDDMLRAALDGNTTNVYTPKSALTVDDIPNALAMFGEDMDGQKALIVDPAFYAQLLKTDWVPASEIAANIKIRGSIGMAYGAQVIVSNRVKGKNFYIVKPGALAIFMKRDTLVEYDRDIINQSNVVVGSKMFAPYLYKPADAIKIVNSTSSGGGASGSDTLGSGG